MRQGESGETAYVIESGQVEILIKKEDGRTHKFGTRGPGSISARWQLLIINPERQVFVPLNNVKFWKFLVKIFTDASVPVILCFKRLCRLF